MNSILELIVGLVMLLVEALSVYDQTPEGKAAIDEFLTLVEAEGFDIPFWEPPDTQAEAGASSPVREAVDEAAHQAAARFSESFVERHPELFNKRPTWEDIKAQEGEGG